MRSWAEDAATKKRWRFSCISRGNGSPASPFQFRGAWTREPCKEESVLGSSHGESGRSPAPSGALRISQGSPGVAHRVAGTEKGSDARSSLPLSSVVSHLPTGQLSVIASCPPLTPAAPAPTRASLQLLPAFLQTPPSCS